MCGVFSPYGGYLVIIGLSHLHLWLIYKVNFFYMESPPSRQRLLSAYRWPICAILLYLYNLDRAIYSSDESAVSYPKYHTPNNYKVQKTLPLLPWELIFILHCTIWFLHRQRVCSTCLCMIIVMLAYHWYSKQSLILNSWSKNYWTTTVSTVSTIKCCVAILKIRKKEE